MYRGKHKGERGEERMIVALGIFLCICSADGGFKGGCNVTLGGKEGERGMWGGGAEFSGHDLWAAERGLLGKERGFKEEERQKGWPPFAAHVRDLSTVDTWE